MEGKAYATCFDPVLRSLEIELENSRNRGSYQHLEDPVEMMRLELTFLKMFFRGLAYWEELEYDWHMLFAINSLIPKLSQLAKGPDQWMNWDAMVYELEEAIREFKPHVKDICIHLLGGAFKCTSCPSNQNGFLEYARETASFIDLVQQNLRDLQKSSLIAPVVKQYTALIQGRLEECGSYVDPATLSITKVKKLYGLISRARTWLNRISCLTYLYFVEGNDDSLASSMETMLFGFLHKNAPFNASGVISSNSQRTMISQLLGRHFDFLLESLVIPMIDDLHEGLLFLLSFIMDPPEDDSEVREMICTQICSIINEFLCLTHSSQSSEMKGGIYNVYSYDFKLKVERVKDKVKKLYVVTPHSTQLRPPFTNPIGFLNIAIRNVKEMLQEEVNLIPSLRHQGEFLLNELVLLKLVERNVTELLEDEIHDLWTSVISTVYRADYFMKLCLLRGLYLWYGIVNLLGVIEDVQSIRIEMNKLVGVDKSHNKKERPHDPHQMDALLQRGTISAIERDFTGFMEVQRMTINELVRGQRSLQIISLSGSGGQGKTTLAKRIYCDTNVQYHFQKSAWCYVSKDCPIKEILVQILSCDTNSGDANELELNDLVERVWKSFKRTRYLIVMDDIWDSDSWHKLESAFPDDENGSRILFTSRSHDLALQVGSSSISHPLPLFSDEESWELMRKKVFGFDNGDEELVGIGKKIASYCKGLPLAVVLIAGVLRKTEQFLNSWNQVAENLKVHLAGEGCGDVIETSYKYLPDHLKSCFLYFGAFARGENLSAKNLKLHWIGEGFIIQDRETKSSKEDLASDYLEDLASQGLVMVTERASMGGIKRCTVHDLLYDLCLERCKKDSFLNWAEGSSIFGYENGKVHKYNHHRLRIGASDPFIKPSPIVTKRELPTSPLHSFMWLSNNGSDSSFRFIESFKFMSVLNLNVGSGANTFPRVILSSIFLRFLALHFPRNIEEVPPEIANLGKLETLIIDWHNQHGCTWLHVCMWNMKSLRHLDIQEAGLSMKGSDQKNSGNASNIETLGSIRLYVSDNTTAEFLRRFPNLRELSCDITGKSSESSTAHLMKLLPMVRCLLPQLESLKVGHKHNPVKHPSPISCHFGNIENLKKLSLQGTEIPWRVLSEISKQLPNLQVLKLLERACGRWYEDRCFQLEHGDFPKLIYLKFSGVELEEMDFSSCEDNPFPLLEHLVLDECQYLMDIPSEFEDMSTLKTIKVSHCRKKVQDSAMGISERQRDYGNGSFQSHEEFVYMVKLNKPQMLEITGKVATTGFYGISMSMALLEHVCCGRFRRSVVDCFVLLWIAFYFKSL